jgi:diketogulonate reductase-like aldo/keto reductase
MAYSPIDRGRLLRDRVLTAVATRHRATTAQIALAWVLRRPDMMVIPKAATLEHVRENRAALDIRLTDQDSAELNRAFRLRRVLGQFKSIIRNCVSMTTYERLQKINVKVGLTW